MICEFWLSQRYLKSGKKERIISLTGLISMVGIAIGVAVLIVVIAVMSGFDRYLQDKLIGANADITMQFYDGYRNPQALMEKVNKLPHVKASAPYIAGQAFMKIGTQIIGMEMRGIDPKSQQSVTRFKEYIKKGTFDIAGAEIIVGEELAVKLGLKIGDTVKLVSPATLTPLDFKVKGIFNSGMYLYDSGLVLTSMKGAQDFFRMGETVSGIAVKTDDVYKVEAVKEDIYAKLGGTGFFDAMTWIDSNRSFLNALKLEKIVMFIVVTMTTVVAAFGIVSTLIMSVMSKIRDIGILRAIGAR
ncbi:MAG: ABC transporter permease, partial [Candidatus Omnitrophica bacterium]|nr:ABC transporter permease [Candidatus Omnitrophota bacterium]